MKFPKVSENTSTILMFISSFIFGPLVGELLIHLYIWSGVCIFFFACIINCLVLPRMIDWNKK